MQASDVMTHDVVSVAPETPVAEIVRVLLRHAFSGVPVLDADGMLVGLVSQGDLLRRAELGTQKRRGTWREFFTGTATLAGEYVRSHGLVARDVMTRDVVCVGPQTPLDAVADLMEMHHIKRVPVMDERRLVGIVSRSNLLRALASRVDPGKPALASDAAIRAALMAELAGQAWCRRADNSVVVTDGVVHLWGLVTSQDESRALELAAQSVGGVRAVQNHTIVLSYLPYPIYGAG